MLGISKAQFSHDLRSQTAVPASNMTATSAKHQNSASTSGSLTKADSSHPPIHQNSDSDSENDSFDEQVKFALFARKKNYGTMPVTAAKQDRANDSAMHEVNNIPSTPTTFSFLGIRI